MTVSIEKSKLSSLAYCPICKCKTVVADYSYVEQNSHSIRCYCCGCGSSFSRQYFTSEEAAEVMRLYGQDPYYKGPTIKAEDDFLEDLKELCEVEELTTGMFPS